MIRKLEVRNFKRFRDATFELDDQLVIVGSNNCGKTTVLQAIALWAEAWGHWSQDAAASGVATQQQLRSAYVGGQLCRDHT